MKKIFLYISFVCIVITLFFNVGNAQLFGQNKVQYDLFDWNILQTPHYEIYYYAGGERLALIAAEIAEQAYHKLEKEMQHSPAKKTPIILYNSHNHFKQTNVTLSMIGEGTGGFTEIFRTRVVVPFTGSYADFDHVLTHELVHVFHIDMLYGHLMNTMSGTRALYPIPLWLIEGTAEYFSNPWDEDEDIFMRDAVVSGYVIPLEYLENAGGYIIYKLGQSVLKYVEEKYGYEKIIELYRNLKVSRNFDKSLEMTLGIDLEKLDEEWQRWLKRAYWPSLVERSEPSEFSKKMTDHKDDGSNLNMAPSLSPDGDKLVYISDKEQYTNIFLMSAIDGEILATLVKGEQSTDFEYLHSFSSQITWSPDSKYISFTAKAGDQDAIFIFDVRKTKVVRKIKLNLDGVYSPSWSPDGDEIVFSGLKDGKSDLYILKEVDRIISGEEKDFSVERLWEDEWDDRHPAWSPDGKYIAFSSDRLDEEHDEFICFHYGRYDIFLMEVETKELTRLTQSEAIDQSPTWLPDSKRVAFVSDRDSAENLYIYNIENDSLSQFTDVLTNIITPSWASKTDRLAFSSFNQGRWNIFLLNEPDKFKFDEELSDSTSVSELTLLTRQIPDSFMTLEPLKPNFISDDSASNDVLEEFGRNFRKRKYKTKFGIDALGGGVSYNTVGSFYAMSQLSFSDVMGDNRISVGLSAFGNSLEEADAFVYYYYLPRKTDYGFGLFHFKNYYYTNKSIFGEYFSKDLPYSERFYGLDFGLTHPFNRYRRINLSCRMMRVERDIYEEYYGWYVLDDQQDMNIFQLETAWVFDNTLWGYVGPENGQRYYLRVENTLFSDLEYTTTMAEYRKYIPLFNKRFNLAFRALGAFSEGAQNQIFHIGGPETLRGYDYEEMSGSRVALLNVEFRYPFIDYMAFVMPLPLHFQYIRGVTFFDLGSAWDKDKDESWRGVTTAEDGGHKLNDLQASWGVGWRMRLAYYVIKFDIGWGTNFSSQTDERYNFSIGAEF